MPTPDDKMPASVGDTGRAVEVDHFSFRLAKKQILHDVSFAVRKGEYLAIVGPNGAGKTTLIKCLDKILVGGTGRIEVFGRPLERYRQKELARLISYVPQADERVSPFTVEQFVLMGRYPYLSPFSPVSKKDREVVCRSMEQTDTGQFADRRLGTLSSGERQKVYIAAALAQGAEILLLDEPTTFLDYRHQAEIRMLLSQINRTSSATVVTVTHDLNHAVLESDRILALREGRVAFCGPPGEIMKQEVLQRIYGTAFLLVDHPDVPLPVIVPHAPSERKP